MKKKMIIQAALILSTSNQDVGCRSYFVLLVSEQFNCPHFSFLIYQLGRPNPVIETQISENHGYFEISDIGNQYPLFLL